MGIIQQVQYAISVAGEIIIDTKNIMTILKESFTEMGAQETCSSGNQYSFCSEKCHIQPF